MSLQRRKTSNCRMTMDNKANFYVLAERRSGLRKRIMVFLSLMLLIICGLSAASAQGFKVQLMEEGTEYTQFSGGWPWDIQPFSLPYQQPDDRVICGAWVPKATPVHQDCILAAVERGNRFLLVGGVKTDNGWKKTILSDCFFRENQDFSIVGLKLVNPDNSSMFRIYPAVVYDNEYYCIAITDTGEFFFAHYIRLEADGSVYDASLSSGCLEVIQSSDAGFRLLISKPIMNPGRLDIVTASNFPTTVDDTAEYVKKYPATLPDNHVIIQGVNLRKEATGKSPSLGKYDFALAEFLGEKEGAEVPWAHVRIGETEGWVSSRYLRRSVTEISESVSWLAMKIGGVDGETTLYDTLDSASGKTISLPCCMYILADCGSRYHVLIPSTGFGWPIDWNGTYGYVPKDDSIVIRTSVLDLMDPGYSPASQPQEQSNERTEDEIITMLRDHCFINPDGGRYAHLDQYCRSVHQKYLPPNKVEYTDEIAHKYELCPVCCIHP